MHNALPGKKTDWTVNTCVCVTVWSEVRVYTVLNRLHSWIMCSVPAQGVIMSKEISKVYIMSKNLSRVTGRRI